MCVCCASICLPVSASVSEKVHLKRRTSQRQILAFRILKMPLVPAYLSLILGMRSWHRNWFAKYLQVVRRSTYIVRDKRTDFVNSGLDRRQNVYASE